MVHVRASREGALVAEDVHSLSATVDIDGSEIWAGYSEFTMKDEADETNAHVSFRCLSSIRLTAAA